VSCPQLRAWQANSGRLHHHCCFVFVCIANVGVSQMRLQLVFLLAMLLQLDAQFLV
jgi:hypothetical protein